MNCPLCTCTGNRVLETTDNGREIRRRRHCSCCGHRWTTYETSEADLARLRKIEQAVSAAAEHLDTH